MNLLAGTGLQLDNDLVRNENSHGAPTFLTVASNSVVITTMAP